MRAIEGTKPDLPEGGLSSEPIVRADNIFKTYGSITVLSIPDRLDVHPGITSITGQSGSGKSTLLNILAGFVQPTAGRVVHTHQGEYVYPPVEPASGIRGIGNTVLKAIRVQTASDRIAASYRSNYMGYISQQPALHPNLALGDYVRLVQTCRGNDVDESYLQELASTIGISTLLKKVPSQLSGGEEQRGAIVTALINRPRIVFADEPTSALDSESGIRCLKLFRHIANTQQTSFVIVSHDSRLEDYADHSLRLSNGQLC